jgi:hypothetical protein
MPAKRHQLPADTDKAPVGHDADAALRAERRAVLRMFILDDLRAKIRAHARQARIEDIEDLTDETLNFALTGALITIDEHINQLSLDQRQLNDLHTFRRRNDYISVQMLLNELIPGYVGIWSPEVSRIEDNFRRQHRSRLDDLISNKEYAKDSSTMEVNPQPTTFQEPGADERLLEAPAHPEPDTAGELKLVASKAAHLQDVIADIQERGRPLTAAEAEIAIAGLHEIAVRSSRTARQLGLHAVQRGLISQTKLGELLGISKMTVSRWYRHGLDDSEEQK